MMKKMIALVLIAMLLLTGCQTNGEQSIAADATEPTATYDWMAGESPVTPQRMGLKRAGVNNADFAIAPNGVYFMYDTGRATGDGEKISFVLYSDYSSDTVIKLCGRADCDHNNPDCNAYIAGGNNIYYHEGYNIFLQTTEYISLDCDNLYLSCDICHCPHYSLSHFKYQLSHLRQFNEFEVFSTINRGVDMTENNEKQFDNSERYRDLGYAISYYRKRKGLTQEQLADKIGISRQHMGAIEAPNMVRAISLDVLFNIATALEIEPYILLKFSPEK